MTRTNLLDIAVVHSRLAERGLNLFQVFPVAGLADSVPDFDIPASSRHLLLVGSAGSDLWSAMPSDYLRKDHPVDEYSSDCINNCLSDHLARDQWSILFPATPASQKAGDIPVPLQKLGALAGWHYPSPLGIGINATHGLWFAYRAVVAIDADLTGAYSSEIASDSPCLSCETTPCLAHCPADALAIGQVPDLNACVNHRVSDESSCASTCLARLACPVGVRFKYTQAQTAYFYTRSLASAKRWIDNG